MAVDPEPVNHEQADRLGAVAAKAREDVLARCADTRLVAEVADTPDEDPGLRLSFPNGKEKRTLLVRDSDIEVLLQTDFEHRAFLGDYDATLNYETGTIEAVLRPLGSPIAALRLKNLVARGDLRVQDGTAEVVDDTVRLEMRSRTGRRLVLGPSEGFLRLLDARPRGLTLTLVDTGIQRHDEALQRLETDGNAFLLALEQLTGLALNVQRRRDNPPPPILVARDRPERVVRYPDYQFDPEPLSLYWFALTARGMPLVQYLAYYQCLEYYFPTYSLNEVRRRVKNELKAPTFAVESDAALGRLIQVARASSGGGNEQAQLAATIAECVSPDDLRAFIDSEDEVRDALTSKQQPLRLQKVAISDDLRSDIARRIYAIRCQIVHAKDGYDESGPLLPFSREAGLIFPDIRLIRFVAQRVLVAASRPMDGPL